MSLLHFTDANFKDDVLNSKGLVVVDFFATWCGPCHQLAPIVEELAGTYEGKMKIGKLDVDDNGETASQYQVMSIPTMIFFKDGKMVDQHVGFISKEALVQKIEGLM